MIKLCCMTSKKKAAQQLNLVTLPLVSLLPFLLCRYTGWLINTNGGRGWFLRNKFSIQLLRFLGTTGDERCFVATLSGSKGCCDRMAPGFIANSNVTRPLSYCYQINQKLKHTTYDCDFIDNVLLQVMKNKTTRHRHD